MKTSTQRRPNRKLPLRISRERFILLRSIAWAVRKKQYLRAEQLTDQLHSLETKELASIWATS